MKPFEQWDFDDLCASNSWSVIQGMASGEKLSNVMHRVCLTAIQWRDQELKKQAEAAKKAKKKLDN